MRILHTSDWHIGNRLMDRSREDEFRAFFAWLAGVLQEKQVDALLVCGDVFDTSTPGDTARAIYCDFLGKAYQAGCRQVIITAGNHDGISNLVAEAPILHLLGSRVVARLRTEDAAQCLVPLLGRDGAPAALACAVPYLRPQDVTLSVPVDDTERRARAYVDGVAACYARVAEAAEAWKQAHPGLPVIAMGHLALGGAEAWKQAHPGLPVIAMGHLALGGAEVSASTRRIIGTLDAVPAEAFPTVFDYVALGHIHRPQSLQGGRIRYCGSPLPMGVDEARQPGKLILFDTEAGVEEIGIPRFTLYETATCSTQAEVEELLGVLGERSAAAGGAPVCLQLSYTGTDCTLRALYELVTAKGPAYNVVHQLISHDTPGTTTRRNTQEPAELPTLHELGEQHLFRQKLDEWAGGTDLPPELRARLESLFSQASAEAHATLREEA